MAFASPEIIGILSKIKYPYNVNQLTQKQAVEMLHRYYEIERWVKTLKEERENLEAEFAALPCDGEDVPFPCQFLPGPCDGCREDLQLSGRQGYHCPQP